MLKNKYPNGVVPHEKSLGITYTRWDIAYKPQLVELYQRFLDTIYQHNPDLMWLFNTKESFLLFSEMVYKSSSKYITPY